MSSAARDEDAPDAAHLVESIREDALGALNDIKDPVARELAAREALSAAADLRGDFARVRSAAAQELYDGDRDGGRPRMSWAGVGRALGVTRVRAKQIAEGR